MASLAPYKAKRNFKATTEPQGGKSTPQGNSFVIQKHAARRLHYDFRLEMDGVLKSWAVTRGPSLVPGEKRLAVHVEDHPLDYATFEGAIPKGEYGGGNVLVWDRGTWAPLGDAHKGLTKGHLEFELSGAKLSGRWHLIRMHGSRNESKENWLLIKGEDNAARSEHDPDILEERPESVITGKTIDDVAEPKPTRRAKSRKAPDAPEAHKANGTAAAALTASSLKKAVKAPLPDFVEPALAKLKDSPPPGAQWVHEIKFDGYRLEARIEAGQVKLMTRSGLDWTGKFGKQVVKALQDLPAKTALIDGELVVESGYGSSDFSALQADLSEGRDDRFVFYVFDLLYLDGYDLREATLLERKAMLAQVVAGSGGMLRYSEHFTNAGNLVLQHACRLSLEGVVSKKSDAPYSSGREGSWIKSKCTARQEFVVAGYVPSTVSDDAIGSLVLGVYEGGGLQHVGRVGTGFPQKVSEDLRRRLDAIAIDKSPFAERLTREESSQVRFVKPDLVAEVEFRGWTGDGNLRHASFRGLREDKEATSVVRETAVEKKPTKEEKKDAERKRSVRLTHPDRIYWPDTGLTKEGLADYYSAVWPQIGPMIVNRPLALLRCPEGIEGQSFFQKHGWRGMSKDIDTTRDPADKEDEPYIYITDFNGLMGLVQGAALEIHPWGSTLSDWERPDMITMDLDPGEGVAWSAVVAAALEAADRLRKAGLEAFLKTSGGKGLHVVSPLKPSAQWPEIKAFTKGIADAMAADNPDAYVSTITKSKRLGKILVDYLRNQRGMTAVAPYSTRARPGAPVSMPVEWDEIKELVGAGQFNVANALNRISGRRKDPWEDFRRAAAPLEAKPARRRKS